MRIAGRSVGRMFGVVMASLVAAFFVCPRFAFAVTDYDSSRYIVRPSLNAEPNSESGAFEQNYQFTIPPGRNGMQPSLGLNYSSGDTANVNEFGYGWSFSIPSITRLPKHGTDDLYTRHDFTSTMSGELSDIVLSDATHGTFGAKVDDGSMLDYTYSTSETWTAVDKNGTTYTFGASSSARVANPSNSSHVYQWMLTSVSDLLGNTVTYTYTTDGAQVYPSTINYTGFGATSGIFNVSFVLESRSDSLGSHSAGFLVTTSYRVKTIAVAVNTQTVRSYALAYGTGDDGLRSLLSSITETATTDDGTSSLSKPATTFTYADGNSAWASSSVTFPETIAGDSAGSLGVYLFDMNGDGISDIIKSRNTTRAIYTGNGNGTWTASTVTPPIAFASSIGRDMGVRVMDMNGDGALDLVYARYLSTGTLDQSIYINNNDGTGWTLSTTASVPIGFTTDGGLYIGVEAFDVDGDGLADIVKSRDGEAQEVYINNGNGTGWTLTTGYVVPVFFASSSPSDMGVRQMDVNGDGLSDLVYARYVSGTLNQAVYLNNGNGTGWTQDTTWTVPEGFLTSSTDYGLRPMDVNGDGLVDLVYHRSTGSTEPQAVYINTGKSWVADASITTPLYFVYSGLDMGVRVDDFDADGLPDILKSRNSGSGTVNELYLATGVVADLMTSTTTSESASTAVTYGTSVNGSNGALPFVLQVASSIVTNDGLGNTATKTYSYTGGDYYGSYFEKKFAGFATVTATDTAGTTKKFFHQGNSTNSTQGESTDSEAKIGRQYREERADTSAHIYQTTIDSWDSINLGTNRDFVYRSQTLSLLYGSSSSHSDTGSAFVYDSFGNVTQRVDYGSVTGTDAGSVTDTGSDKRTTTTLYAVDSAGIVQDMPAQVTVTNSVSTTIAKSRTLYDSLAYGSVSSGKVTTEQQWISGSTYASTLHTYDSYGNVLTTTGPNGGVTTTVYDSIAHQYPSTTTNAMSHVVTTVYSLGTGKPTSVTNPNGSIVTTTYDAFGRPVSESQSSDASATTMVVTKTWSYSDSSSPRSVTAREYLSATVYKETITFIDGFDRTVEVKTRAASGSGYNESQTSYDTLGRVSSTTLPQATTLSTYESTAVSSSLAQTFSYDALSRVTSVIDALGTTSTSYSGLAKTVTDARGKQKIYTTDSLGRLATVVEYISGTPYTTSYTYNATDALTKVTDSIANVRNFTYDGRNLRLTAQDLHASTDTTFGTWTFTYDTSGNLSTSVSPNAITTTYTYDLLNRTLTENASSTTGTDVTYGYDSCTHGTGLLCTTSVNGGASTVNVYTANNRISSETKTISSVAYVTTTTYDYAGNPLTITHPNSTIVRNTYNVIGALATVEKKTSLDTSYVMVTSAFAYGPDGQLTVQTNANGTVTTNTYDATKRYRLTRKVTTGFASSSTTSAPTTVIFYPSAGDGYSYKNNASWDTAHDAITGVGALGTVTTATVGVAKSLTNYYLYRSLLPFDTSSLPDDATITSATLNAYVASKINNDNDGDDFLTVVQSTQTSTATLSTSDYGRTGATNNPTEGVDVTGRKDITSISSNAWLTFTLNTTGQGFISKTSSSKFAIREGHDVIDSSFTSTSTTATQYNTVAFRTSEYTGTTYDPYLSVTYTTPSSTTSSATNLQDLSYTYDAVGNILTIVDASNETTAKTTTYAYDDLSRLTSEAVTSSANGDNTTITYTYNALGNITFRSDKGTYTYAGNTGSSYANPHAVTSILKTDGTTQTFTYDNNGNLTSDGTTTYAWDYKNRLTGSATISSSSSTTTTTATFAPTTGDGYVYNGSSSTWATNHDATSGSYANATTTQVMAQTGKDSSGTTPYNIVRALFPFNTASIPTTATITSASLSVYVYGKGDQIVDAYDYATVVQSTQTSTTTVANGDYSKVGTATSPTEGIATTERKDLATVSTGAYLTFTLNATGRGFITKAGVTKLGVREGHDTASISTGVTAGKYNYLNMYSGEQAGTTQDPYLSVTYTTPSSSSSTTINPVTYTYDAFDARTTKSATVTSTGIVTTSIYPSGSYSIDGSTTTVYLSGPSNSSLASILNTGTTSSILSTIHSDHLGSTAVLSDTSGIMTELLDYHGYGNSRLTSGVATAKKTFIGQYSDSETSLSYLNARYYDSVRGQFMSEDSVFLGMGTWNKKVQLALLDPQLQNSYSYARDNPMTLKDADGNWPQWMSSALSMADSVVNIGYNFITLGAGDRAAEMGRSGVTIGGVAHVVGGVTFGVVSTSIIAIDVGAALGGLAIDVGMIISRQQRSTIQAINRADLPKYAQETLNNLENNGFKNPLPGYKGGRTWMNKDSQLPTGTTYREWDVAPQAQGRTAERFVSGENGKTYWTDTHYGDKSGTAFSEVK